MSIAYKNFRKVFQDMFINIRHNCAFQENYKIRKLEVVSVGILGTGFCFLGSH